jgi:hypothetical protein
MIHLIESGEHVSVFASKGERAVEVKRVAIGGDEMGSYTDGYSLSHILSYIFFLSYPVL